MRSLPYQQRKKRCVCDNECVWCGHRILINCNCLVGLSMSMPFSSLKFPQHLKIFRNWQITCSYEMLLYFCITLVEGAVRSLEDKKVECLCRFASLWVYTHFFICICLIYWMSELTGTCVCPHEWSMFILVNILENKGKWPGMKGVRLGGRRDSHLNVRPKILFLQLVQHLQTHTNAILCATIIRNN